MLRELRPHRGSILEVKFVGWSHLEPKEERHYGEKSSFENCVLRVENYLEKIGYDTRRPPSPYARDFLYTVSHYMHRPRDLHFIPSVGFQLDWMWGVDFLLRYQEEKTSVDITKSKEGKPNPKADFVLTLDAINKKNYHEIASGIALRLELAKAA